MRTYLKRIKFINCTVHKTKFADRDPEQNLFIELLGIRIRIPNAFPDLRIKISRGKVSKNKIICKNFSSSHFFDQFSCERNNNFDRLKGTGSRDKIYIC
jgi:hypothetical protein